jgi:hypothetical protein
MDASRWLRNQLEADDNRWLRETVSSSLRTLCRLKLACCAFA